MGAGVDTRAFWFKALSKTSIYIEVDTKPVIDYKEKVFADLKSKGMLPETVCPRKVITMDY